MIEVQGLSLTISKTEILKHIDIRFESGKIHGLIGRNGSGKTMLMKCICGFIRPTVGIVIGAGKQIGKDCEFPEFSSPTRCALSINAAIAAPRT